MDNRVLEFRTGLDIGNRDTKLSEEIGNGLIGSDRVFRRGVKPAGTDADRTEINAPARLIPQIIGEFHSRHLREEVGIALHLGKSDFQCLHEFHALDGETHQMEPVTAPCRVIPVTHRAEHIGPHDRTLVNLFGNQTKGGKCYLRARESPKGIRHEVAQRRVAKRRIGVKFLFQRSQGHGNHPIVHTAVLGHDLGFQAVHHRLNLRHGGDFPGHRNGVPVFEVHRTVSPHGDAEFADIFIRIAGLHDQRALATGRCDCLGRAQELMVMAADDEVNP